MKHKARLLANVTDMSDDFRVRLSQMKCKHPATVRVKGLAIGVELGHAEYVENVVEKCRRAGLFLSGEEDVLLMFPALNIERNVVQKGLDIFEACL
jgi:4-aminobutyrate aminotransferase-like enzyme